MSKELLLRITAADCDWEYFRGSGNGGQKKQKTSSAVRCVHKASGAVGRAEDYRSQAQNKQAAFKRMSETKEFKQWLQLEIAKISGVEEMARAYAEREVNSGRVKMEIKVGGKWTETTEENLDDSMVP